ncbi:MAG: hypothetical protein ACYDGS_06280 [Thermoleophilia bacterium]
MIDEGKAAGPATEEKNELRHLRRRVKLFEEEKESRETWVTSKTLSINWEMIH